MFFSWLIFIIIEAYLFFQVLLPYFYYDQFQFWDAAGHFFAAWFQRNYLFPFFSGWNPFFFGGYPQGTFYGPIYHYLIALFSFPLGLPLAFKLLTIISIAILPFSLYYLARKFNFDSIEASSITALTMLPIAGLNLACGGTLFSQFTVGLGAHTLGLPIFLFYFGRLKAHFETASEKTENPLDLPLLTILAATLVLLHFVIAFAAMVVAVILTLNHFNRGALLFAFKHALLTFLVSAFFLLPLIAYGSLTENPGTILSMGFFLTIPSFLLIMLGGAASILDKDKRFNHIYFVLIAIFAVMAFIDFGQIGLPMHAYRFIIFFLILAWMLPVKLIFNQLENRRLKISLFLVFLILLGWQLKIILINNPRAEINNNRLFVYQNFNLPYRSEINLGSLKGRIMLLEGNNPLAPRAIEHLLARVTQNKFLSGLFAESSAHSGYIHTLRAKTVALLSGGGNNSPALLQNVSKLLNLFQVNYLLSEAPVKGSKLLKTISLRSDRPDAFLYQIGSFEVVEALSYQPYFTEKGWQAACRQWFETPDPRMLVRASNLPPLAASAKDKITITEEKISPPLLKFKVQAKERIPLLIKISYFPRWKAYVDGKPAKIYQAAPSFMLIYGRGNVRLEYKPTLIDQLGKILSLLGLSLLGWVLYTALKRKHAAN